MDLIEAVLVMMHTGLLIYVFRLQLLRARFVVQMQRLVHPLCPAFPAHRVQVMGCLSFRRLLYVCTPASHTDQQGLQPAMHGKKSEQIKREGKGRESILSFSVLFPSFSLPFYCSPRLLFFFPRLAGCSSECGACVWSM